MADATLQALASINLKAPSYSRAGRMSETLAGGQLAVRTEPRGKGSKVDPLKVLTAGDISSGTNVVANVSDEEAYDGGEELCSSARDHPAAVKRAKYVSTIEKEIGFANAMDKLKPRKLSIPQLLSEEELQRKQLARQSAAVSPKRAQSPEGNKREPPVAVASILAKRRALDQNPPVGHYHPRYTVMDPHHQTAFISKVSRDLGPSPKRQHTPTSQSSHDATHTTSLGATLEDMDPLSTTLRSTSVGAPSPSSAQGAAPLGKSPVPGQPTQGQAAAQQPAKQVPLGTSAFLSRVPKGGPVKKRHRRGQSVPLAEYRGEYNDLVFRPPPNRSNVRFDRQVTREQRERISKTSAMGSTDLSYNPKLEPFHSPAHPFDSFVPRDKGEKVPRTSNDIEPRIRPLPVPNSDKHKFRRQPCLANFGRQTSRKVEVNNMIVLKMNRTVGTSEIAGPIDLPDPMARHSPAFKMAHIPGRKPQKPRLAQDVIYDPHYETQEKKWPDTHITATPDRPKIGLPGCETIQISVGKYRTDTDLVHKRVLKNVEIRRVVSRDKREHVATGHIDKISNAQYEVKHDFHDRRITGNPMLGSHMTREKRMHLVSPTPAPLDKTYDWDVNKQYPPLRKGAVEIDKMVQRAVHAGSAFSNDLKRSVSPQELVRARSCSPRH